MQAGVARSQQHRTTALSHLLIKGSSGGGDEDAAGGIEADQIPGLIRNDKQTDRDTPKDQFSSNQVQG